MAKKLKVDSKLNHDLDRDGITDQVIDWLREDPRV